MVYYVTDNPDIRNFLADMLWGTDPAGPFTLTTAELPNVIDTVLDFRSQTVGISDSLTVWDSGFAGTWRNVSNAGIDSISVHRLENSVMFLDGDLDNTIDEFDMQTVLELYSYNLGAGLWCHTGAGTITLDYGAFGGYSLFSFAGLFSGVIAINLQGGSADANIVIALTSDHPNTQVYFQDSGSPNSNVKARLLIGPAVGDYYVTGFEFAGLDPSGYQGDLAGKIRLCSPRYSDEWGNWYPSGEGYVTGLRDIIPGGLIESADYTATAPITMRDGLGGTIRYISSSVHARDVYQLEGANTPHLDVTQLFARNIYVNSTGVPGATSVYNAHVSGIGSYRFAGKQYGPFVTAATNTGSAPVVVGYKLLIPPGGTLTDALAAAVPNPPVPIGIPGCN